MTSPIAPTPRSLCAAFAPLLPLLSSSALEEDEVAPTREHVASCAWCQQELARYTAVDDALRREFGVEAPETIVPLPFNLDGDEDYPGGYAFTLEDTLEEPMEGDQGNQRPSTTVRSSRWGSRKRGLSPRATAIAGIAAALILAVVATTIYTQFAARRTTSSPGATTTASGAFTKVIKLPNITGGLTITSDGSLWFTEYADLHSKIGRLSPDGTLTEFPLPSADKAKHAGVGDLTLGPDRNLWYVFTNGFADQTSTSSIMRMTPDGAMTTIWSRPNVEVGNLLFTRDGALWFQEGSELGVKMGRLTSDLHLTEYALSGPKGAAVLDLCVGPDNALWFTLFRSNRIGRITVSGQIQEFDVPYPGSRITSGSDGALWFSETVPPSQQDETTYARKGVLGRITTSGAYNEVAINPTLVAQDIVTGPDGAIWFSAVDQADSTLKLGRLSASGDVKLYSTNEYGTAGYLAVAPGALWMVNLGSNTLWRYRLSE